jgi:uncharacterized coiled-coil DUF342 family protein
MTPTATSQSITIPINQWNELKNECQLLNQDLIQCQTDLKKLKKPSSELVSELAEAQAMLLKLTKELEEQKADLTMLSNEVKESKALLQTLKNQIEKERKIHKRQVWQNRFWCILIGAGIGFVAGR